MTFSPRETEGSYWTGDEWRWHLEAPGSVPTIGVIGGKSIG